MKLRKPNWKDVGGKSPFLNVSKTKPDKKKILLDEDVSEEEE